MTRSVMVEASFPVAGTPAEGLPVGTFAQVRWTGDPIPEAIWVDDRWIAYRDGRAVVFVLDESGQSEPGPRLVRERRVTFRAGLFGGGRVLVSGVADGERLVTSSLELIGDGAEVLPIVAAESAESAGDASQ